MAFNSGYGRTDARGDTDAVQPVRPTPSGPSELYSRLGAMHQETQRMVSTPNSHALNEVLRQVNEEKARYQVEMENMKVEMRSQQAILQQIAEKLLEGVLDQELSASRSEMEKLRQSQDLQAAALRESLIDLQEHKDVVQAQSRELKSVFQLCEEMREDVNIESKGFIEASSGRVVQECRSLMAQELETMRKEMLDLKEELRTKIDDNRISQERDLKNLQELNQVSEKKLLELNQKILDMPDPAEALKAQQTSVAMAEKAEEAAANALTALQQAFETAAKVEEHKSTLESCVKCAEEHMQKSQEAVGDASNMVELAANHAKNLETAATAVAAAVTNAEMQAQLAREAADIIQQSVVSAESSAQKALEAKNASELSAEKTENHMTVTTNALNAVQDSETLTESNAQKALEAKTACELAAQSTETHMTTTTNALKAVQDNVASAESSAQKALEAKNASELSARNIENHMLATNNALTAVQENVASAESHAQKALEAKVASERAAESTESHVAAATNALAAVQNNADTAREKTTEVEQHVAFVKDIVKQMADQASALQETSSAVASASDTAASALASEAEKHLATLQERLTAQSEAFTTQHAQVEAHASMSELQQQVEELRSQLESLPSAAPEEHLNALARDLAESVRITDVLSQKIEAVERQFALELSSHKEDVVQKLQRVEATSPKDGEDPGVSQARLEEMIGTALERTDHLEQSLVAMTNGHSSKISSEVSEVHAYLQAEINDLKSRSTSCETRLLEELARVSEALQGRPSQPVSFQRPFEVRSVPAALRGMVHSALPLPPEIHNRKALIIGCSYFDSNSPLSGTFNDAWNVLSLLRHTLQFSESQVRFLVDGSKNCPMPQQRRPTAAVISESLQWLTQDTQPGDSIFLYFAGYGLLLPHGVGTFESCLVPVDYAAMASPQNDIGSGYRLISMQEVSLALAKLPAGCNATVVLDCCHSSLPGLGAKSQPAIFQWAQMQPPAFAGFEEDLPVGLHPKARRLVLPSVPLAGARNAQATSFECSLTCFSACQQAQWCAELPIEGVMQGAFTWAWVKAVIANSGSTSQLQGSIEAHLADLQKRYRWLDQKPQVQMSKVLEQKELGRVEVTSLPDILRRPLPPNVRRKALIIGINYTGSHAQLKGAVNDAWSMHTMLRQSLLLDEDRIRLLVDSDSGNKMKPSQVPTKANILMNLQWLMEGAQPGDSLVLVFCGFGTQHPKDTEGKEHEAFLVPSDYAEDLPKDWWSQVVSPGPPGVPKTIPKPPSNAMYRLISMLELNRYITQIPSGATLTTVLDCAYPAVPGVSPNCNLPPTFQRVQRGRVDYDKMLDFVTRPRFLELPPLPVQHTLPQIWKPQTFPACKLHCFCAGRLQEWPSELPLEGTVQGTFTWAFAKAFAAGELRGTVAQQQQALEAITSELKQHFQGVEQSPALMLSQSASTADSVFA